MTVLRLRAAVWVLPALVGLAACGSKERASVESASESAVATASASASPGVATPTAGTTTTPAPPSSSASPATPTPADSPPKPAKTPPAARHRQRQKSAAVATATPRDRSTPGARQPTAPPRGSAPGAPPGTSPPPEAPPAPETTVAGEPIKTAPGTWTGTGSARLGTLNVPVKSLLTLSTQGDRQVTVSDPTGTLTMTAVRDNTGRTAVPPGSYRDVTITVSSDGPWTLTISSPKH